MPKNNNTRKKVDYEDFDNAIKASFRLGVLEGESKQQRRMTQMRERLSRILKTNKRLWEILADEHKIERVYIPLSPTRVSNILDNLRLSGQDGAFQNLRKHVEKLSGKKYVVEKKGVNAGKKGSLVMVT